MKKYTEKTGNYAKLRIIQAPRGEEDVVERRGKKKMKWTIEVLVFDEKCVFQEKYGFTHADLNVLMELYERAKRDTQRYKILRYQSTNQYILDMLSKSLRAKNSIRRFIEGVVEQTPVGQFTSIVRAVRNARLGPVFALYILGNVDPHIATSAGKAKAILGFTPEGKPRAGQKAKGRIQYKGPIHFAAQRVMKGNDPYYVPLARAKMEYYMKVRQMNETEAWWRAVYWLAALLVSHAAELMREDEGLDVSAYRAHTPYIPPKRDPDQVPDEKLLEAIRQGKT